MRGFDSVLHEIHHRGLQIFGGGFYAGDEGQPIAVDRCLWANETWRRTAPSASSKSAFAVYENDKHQIGGHIRDSGLRAVECYGSGARQHSAAAVPGVELPAPSLSLSSSERELASQHAALSKERNHLANLYACYNNAADDGVEGLGRGHELRGVLAPRGQEQRCNLCCGEDSIRSDWRPFFDTARHPFFNLKGGTFSNRIGSSTA